MIFRHALAEDQAGRAIVAGAGGDRRHWTNSVTLPGPTMRVLAIDPSLRGTGYAILESAAPAANGRPSTALMSMPMKARACAYGTIKNKADLLPSSCLVAIRDRAGRTHPQTRTGMLRGGRHHLCPELQDGHYHGRGARGGHHRGGGTRVADLRILAARGQTGRRRKRRCGKNAGRLHGASSPRTHRNAPAPDAADALAIGLTHLREQSSPLRKVSAIARI